MIGLPSEARVWLAAGYTDMRRGMAGLALQVQEALGRDPHVGDLYVFRGRRGDLVKIIWHDGIGQASGSRQVHLADATRRCRRHLGSTARLHAGRDRLAQSAVDMATGGGRISRSPHILDGRDCCLVIHCRHDIGCIATAR